MDSPGFFYTTLKMIGILTALLGGLYVCLLFMRRLMRTGLGGKQNQLIQVLNVRSVGIKKQIALVGVPGAVLVIGMSGDRMQLLDKIVDAKILDRISAAGGQPVSSEVK